MRVAKKAVEAGPAPPPRPGRRSLLSRRDFRLFFFGNLISNSGTWLQNVAQGVLVFQLTHSSAWVGATQAATFVPILPLALFGGTLADRFDRRHLLIWTQILAMAATGVLAVLAATGHATVGAIMAVALVLGVQYAVAIPASQALVPSLVPREDLGPAVGLTSITYNLARAVGPLLSTAAIAFLGFGLAFGLNSLSFLALILAIAALRPERRQDRAVGSSSIREGLRYAWHDRRIRYLLALVGVISIAIDPVFTLSPVFAHGIFGRPTADAGFLVSAFGTGAIVVAIFVGRLFGRPAEARWRLGAASLVVLMAGLAAFALSPVFGLGVAALALAGMGFLMTVTTWTTAIQEEVTDRLRGRVMAIWTLAVLGSRPLAALFDGSVADLLSPRAAGLLTIVPLAVVAVLLVPRLRPSPGRERVAQSAVPERVPAP